MCHIKKVVAAFFLYSSVFLSSAFAQEAETTETSSSANLLMVNAVELYREAEVLSGQKRIELLREVGEILERIRSDFPGSLPAQFMNDGRPLGPIDMAVVASASETTYSDELPQVTISSVSKVSQQACQALSADQCEQALAEALFEYISIVAFDLERTSNVEQLRWLFSNPGRFSDNLARVNAFDDLLSDDIFRDNFIKRVNSRIMADLGVEITAELAFSLLTGVVSETLAQHYETQGYQEAADFTRTWMEPIVDISLLIEGVSTASTAGAGVGAALIWAKNTYAFWQLGEKQFRAEQTGATADQQIELLAAEIDSYTRTLISGRLTGAAFKDNEGDLLTEQHAEVLKSNLVGHYELLEFWLESDEAILLETFDAVLQTARAFYELTLRFAEPTPLNAADSSGALPADLQGIGLQPAPDGLLGPDMLTNEIPKSEPWHAAPEPSKLSSMGSFPLFGNYVFRAADGSARWDGGQLFAESPNSRSSELLIYPSPTIKYQGALIFQRDPYWGGLRAAVISKMGSDLLKEDLILESQVRGLAKSERVLQPILSVFWSPDGKFVSFPLSASEWQADLVVVDLSSGNHIILSPDDLAPSTWAFPKMTSIRSADGGWLELTYDVLVCGDIDCGKPKKTGEINASHKISELLDLKSYQNSATSTSKTELDSTVAVKTDGWGPSILPASGVELGYRPCGDRTDIRRCLEEKGLGKDAIDFSFAVAGDLVGEVFAIDFQEAGEIDVAHVEFNGASPHNWPILLNGSVGEMAIETTNNLAAVFTDPTSQSMLRRFPQATSRSAQIRSHRLLEDGTQRFALVETIIDGCRACPILGSAITFLEIGPSTSGTLRRTPIGLSLEDPRNSVDLSDQVLRESPKRLQTRLNILGYNSGEMDGYPGPQTSNALSTFQAEHCLSPTDQLQLAIYTALIKASGFETPCRGAKPPEGLDLSGCDPALQPEFPQSWMNANLQGQTVTGSSWDLRLSAPGSSFGVAKFVNAQGNTSDGFWRPTSTGVCQSYDGRQSWICHDVLMCQIQNDRFVLRNEDGELTALVSAGRSTNTSGISTADSTPLIGTFGTDQFLETSCENSPIVVNNSEIFFYESSCRFESQIPMGVNSHTADATCSGEGETWQDRFTLTLIGQETLIVFRDSSDRVLYNRCEIPAATASQGVDRNTSARNDGGNTQIQSSINPSTGVQGVYDYGANMFVRLEDTSDETLTGLFRAFGATASKTKTHYRDISQFEARRLQKEDEEKIEAARALFQGKRVVVEVFEHPINLNVYDFQTKAFLACLHDAHASRRPASLTSWPSNIAISFGEARRDEDKEPTADDVVHRRGEATK